MIDIAKEYEGMGEVSWNIADGVVQGMKKSLKECGNNTLKIFSDMAKKADVPFEVKIVEGQPAAEIMKVAKDANYGYNSYGPFRANWDKHVPHGQHSLKKWSVILKYLY